MGVKGKAKGRDSNEDKVERRASWLSDKVFPDRPIDGEAVAAMQGIAEGVGIGRAMELFRELEEKGDQIKNPSGYLKNAAKREGFGPPEEPPARAGGKGGKGGRAGDPGKVAKRVAWLNAHVFTHSPIDEGALQSMQEIDVFRAMEIFKEAEAQGAGLKNPSRFLRVASNRERGGGAALAVSTPAPAKSAGKGWGGGGGGEHEKIERRAAWLNRNLFSGSPIDEEAVAAMKGMGVARAMELFRELEERNVHNPTGYLKRAAMREGFGPPGAPPPREAGGKAGKAGKGGKGSGGSREAQRVQKRVDWLNKHSFADNPIDADAVAVMLEVDLARAMEVFKELEAKAGEVNNPSAFLISAVKKGGAKRKAPEGASAPAAKKQPAPKKAKVEEGA